MSEGGGKGGAGRGGLTPDLLDDDDDDDDERGLYERGTQYEYGGGEGGGVLRPTSSTMA